MNWVPAETVCCCQQHRHLAEHLHMHFPAPALGEPIEFSSGRSSMAVLPGKKLVHSSTSGHGMGCTHQGRSDWSKMDEHARFSREDIL